MKKITFILLCLMMLCTSASAKITVSKLAINNGIPTPPLSGELTVGLAQWADFQFTNKVLSVTDYPKMRISYSNASGKLYVYIKSLSGQQQEVGTLKNGVDVDTTIVFNQDKFSTNDSIRVNLQGQAPSSVHLNKVVFIRPDGTEMIPTYKTGTWPNNNWGNTITRTPVYSAIATLGQWIRMGGTVWVPTVYAPGETHVFTLKFNAPVPNSKWFLIYVDPSTGKEVYTRVTEGATEFSLTLTKPYGTKMDLQSQMAKNTIDIASITRTVYAPVYLDTLSLYADEYGTEMGEWMDRVKIPAEKFSNAKIYDVIATKISSSTIKSVIGFRENRDNIEDQIPLDSKSGEIAITDTTIAFNYIIKEDSVLKELKKNGLIISGSNYTLKSVDLVTTDDSYDPDATPNAIKGVAKNNGEVVETKIFNVAGQQSSSLMKGINIIRQRLSNGTIKVSKILVK